MRILLIATNRHNRWMSRQEVRPLPIGLAYVAAYIDPERHPLKILDLMFARITWPKLKPRSGNFGRNWSESPFETWIAGATSTPSRPCP